MGSYAKYQIDEEKYKNSSNIFLRRSKTKRKDNKSDKFWENFEYYIVYYRLNPHRFCLEYLGINLYYWQQFILYMMWHTENTIFLAGRGIGKTYLTMVFCIAKAILYPGTIIRVAAANKKQAALLLAKTREIQRNCPMVAREIADISIGKDEARILFHGGSEVATVVASDNARGERCQVLIIDEREICDKDIIDRVFIPFLTATRQPPYLRYPEYRHYKDIEKNHFIELSSVGSKTSSLYAEFEQYINFIKEGNKDYCVFSIPYQYGLESGIINKKIIQKMIRESTTSIESFRREMEVIPTGDNESSMFRFDILNKNRKIYVPMIPITNEEYIEYNGNITKYKFYQKKELGEIRLISMDVALMGGRANDASAFIVFRLTPSENEYLIEIPYIETISGTNVEPQVLRFKQLFYDLECDYACLDGMGVGQAIFDLCSKKTYDPIRNKKYNAWKSRNNEELNLRVIDKTAEPVLFVVKVGGAGASQLHTNMITKARVKFEKKKVYLLKHEDDAIEELDKRYNFNYLKSSNVDSEREMAVRLITPFMQTTKLIEECVNTQVVKLPSGAYRIDEGSGQKDRAMAMLYGLYFIDLLEEDLQQISQQQDWSKYVVVSNGKPTNNIFGNQFKGFGNRGFVNPFKR